MQSIEQRARQIVVGQLGVRADQVRADSSLMGDLAADSLDLLEMTMAMEEEFGIGIPDSDSAKFITFGDAVSYLEKRLK